MIVVADSSPLHYLILVDQVDLLRRFYGEVVIPDTVASELKSVASLPVVSGWIVHLPAWAAVMPVTDARLRPLPTVSTQASGQPSRWPVRFGRISC